MTYEEALHYKSNLPEFSKIKTSGFLAKFYVVPENNNDLMDWLKDFDSLTMTDEMAKKYASNDSYT